MKQFTLRNRQVIENETFSITMNGKINFYVEDRIICTLNNEYLEEVTIENNQIKNTYNDTTIENMIFNSELKRKNKYILDGSSFVYKNDIYICLNNEDFSIKEVLQYNHDTYKSYATVLTINGRNIWVAITRQEEKYNERAKAELDVFFKENMLMSHSDLYTDRLLMLSDDKKQQLIELLMTGKDV